MTLSYEKKNGGRHFVNKHFEPKKARNKNIKTSLQISNQRSKIRWPQPIGNKCLRSTYVNKTLLTRRILSYECTLCVLWIEWKHIGSWFSFSYTPISENNCQNSLYTSRHRIRHCVHFMCPWVYGQSQSHSYKFAFCIYIATFRLFFPFLFLVVGITSTLLYSNAISFECVAIECICCNRVKSEKFLSISSDRKYPKIYELKWSSNHCVELWNKTVL